MDAFTVDTHWNDLHFVTFHWFPVIFCLPGWGLVSRFPPLHYFPNFSTSPKYMLAIKYHVHIWQVSPQLSCGDTYQIWMWSKNVTGTFARSKILLTEKLTKGALVTPTPGRMVGTMIVWNFVQCTGYTVHPIGMDPKNKFQFNWIQGTTNLNQENHLKISSQICRHLLSASMS